MIQYRPDVDGLRTLAVVPVVLYHAQLGILDGGYVGVDVFFVISGFLITLLILSEMEAGRFSIAQFYQRRIIRIFPAFLLVMLFSAAFGWFFYLPDDYKRLGESIFAASTFTSNFYFWKDAGYFGAPPEAKPLLHTWSLSVEEQFYILFPLYVVMIRRWQRSRQITITAVLCIGSFLLSAVGVYIDQSATFFFLPARMWELMIGSLLAMRAFPATANRAVIELISWTGLALIIAPMALYNEQTLFPGLAALLPVSGAGMLIWAGAIGTSTPSRILSAHWAVSLGKMSYPLYLWHFPLFGFAIYLSIGPLPVAYLLAIVALSFVLAYLTWKYVETPIRKAGSMVTPWKVIAIGCATMVIAATLGGLGYLMKGFEHRIGGDQIALVKGMTDRMPEARRCMNPSMDAIAKGNLCILGSGSAAPETVIWGDSFAEALAPGIVEAALRTHSRTILVGRHGCSPYPQRAGKLEQQDRPCAGFNDAVQTWLANNKHLKTVVLVLRWPSATGGKEGQKLPSDDTGRPTALESVGKFSANVAELLQRLTSDGKTVWVVGAIPVNKFVVPRALYVQSLGIDAGTDIRPKKAEYDAAFGWVSRFLDPIAKRNANVKLIDLSNILCDPDACRVVDQGHPLYFDSNHLTTHGARLVSGEFNRVFQ